MEITFKMGDRVIDYRTNDKATVLYDVTGPRGGDGYGVIVEYDDEPGTSVSTGTDYFRLADER